MRATLCEHALHPPKTPEGVFAVESAGWDIAEGFGCVCIGPRRFALYNLVGLWIVVMAPDKSVHGFFADSATLFAETHATAIERIRAIPDGAVVCAAVRNSAVCAQALVPTAIVRALEDRLGGDLPMLR